MLLARYEFKQKTFVVKVEKYQLGEKGKIAFKTKHDKLTFIRQINFFHTTL